MVRKGVSLIPRDFLSHKEIYTGFEEDLRECRGVAEYIREPEIADLLPKLLPKVVFPVKTLAHQRLTTGDIHIRFHPHGTLEFPRTLLDGLFYCRE